MRRAFYPLFLAAICVAVLASHLFIQFERVRYRVAVPPQPGGQSSFAVPLPDLRRLSDAPAAVMLRFSGGDQPSRVAVALDGALIADVTVPAGRTIRVNASAQPEPGSGPSTLHVSSPSPPTAQDGSSSRSKSPTSTAFPTASRSSSSFRASAPGFRPFRSGPSSSSASRSSLFNRIRPGLEGASVERCIGAGGGLVLLLFVVGASQRSVHQVQGVAVAGNVLHLPCHPVFGAVGSRCAAAAERSHIVAGRRFSRIGRDRGPVLWSVGQFYSPDTGFTSLIRFGEEFEQSEVPALRRVPHAVEAGSGYDGQFYAQLALDPLLRTRPTFVALDSAAYRGRRILLPWTSYVLGFGVPRYVVQIYALLNVACWLILGVLLLHWLPAGALRPTLVWITCALNPGLLTSIRNALTDGPSMLILTLGVLASERNRRGLAAGVLGLAGLARETNLLGGLMLAPDSSAKRSVTSLMVQGLVAVLPLVLWIAYLQSIGAPPGDTGPRNFGTPLGGYLEKWTITIRELGASGWESLARVSLLSLIALTTQAVALVWLRDWRSPWWRMGVPYALLMVFLGQAVWEGHPGAATRVLMPMTFAFNLLLPPTRFFWPLWVMGNANVLNGIWI